MNLASVAACHCLPTLGRLPLREIRRIRSFIALLNLGWCSVMTIVRCFSILMTVLFISFAVRSVIIQAKEKPVIEGDLYRWAHDDFLVTFSPSRGADDLTIQINDVTFTPYRGLGPRFEIDGKLYTSADADSVKLVRVDLREDVVHAEYEMVFGNEHCRYFVKTWLENRTLYVSIDSNDNRARGITSGTAEGIKRWRKMDITRYAELYAQPWYPQPVYSYSGKFFMYSDWDFMQGNGTEYIYDVHNPLPSEGMGDLKVVPDVTYVPNTHGEYLHLKETLRFSIADGLWDVVPEVSQQPSEFRNELRDMVYVELLDDAATSLAVMKDLTLLTHDLTRFYVMLQTWAYGHWDQFLPDNFQIPSLVPKNAKDIRELIEFSRPLGFAGLRNNYVYVQDASPSYQNGMIDRAMNLDGTKRWHIKLSQLMDFVPRQQEEIQEFFGEPNAAFSDQLTSGSLTASYIDHDPDVSEGVSMRRNVEHLRELAEYLRDRTNGPLASESLVSEFLLGEWVATGDYGIMDGHHRLFTPDYKLKRLHHLTVYPGMGWMYRFDAMPPWKEWHSDQYYYYSDQDFKDDYRACTVLYGNGAYIYYLPNWPLEEMLVEVLVVGQLQKHYALEEVKEVYYRFDGTWVTLEQLYKERLLTPEVFAQIMVEYKNGLTVVVNRLSEELSVQTQSGEIVLPRYGWVAFTDDDSVLAYSAWFPGTTDRVDYFRDTSGGIEFLNPRGVEIMGTNVLTLWKDGVRISEFDPTTGKAKINGKETRLNSVKPKSGFLWW